MKQTAVESYNEQLNMYGDMAFNKEISLGQYHIKKQELLNQAKEMEKEQILDAFDKAGKSVFHITGHGLSEKENKDFLITAEQYYNETYGKDEK